MRGKVILFGASMGGFAALSYSSTLGADVVIAGAPQVVLDYGMDERWAGEWYEQNFDESADARSGVRREANVVVLYDPCTPLDAAHVDLLPSFVRRACLPGAGHEVFRALIRQDLWQRTQEAIISADDTGLEKVLHSYRPESLDTKVTS